VAPGCQPDLLGHVAELGDGTPQCLVQAEHRVYQGLLIVGMRRPQRLQAPLIRLAGLQGGLFSTR
jgi:hypothetical protein